MAGSCLECHEPIATQIENGKGLHGSLGKERANRCAVCHSEHHGPDFALVNRVSFAQAGIGDPKQFNHAKIGYAMSGRHLELDCAQCHVHADTQPLPAGALRYLGLSQDCASCHHDAHEGRMQLSCTDCHGQQNFRVLQAHDHRDLPLVGGHAALDCSQCHPADGAHSLATLGSGRRPAKPRDCASCHESPHTAGFTDAAAKVARAPVGAACAACHQPEHATFTAARDLLTQEQHAATGFPLAEAHSALACDQCHSASEPTYALRHPGRRADDCRSCHDDVHRGEFVGKAFAERGCVDCHTTAHFVPHTFTVERHAQTSFALHHSHTKLDCRECHRTDADGPARFAGTPSRCEACHDDAHSGAFTRFADELGKQPRGTCAECHVETKFTAVPHERFDHAKWTGFALNGAHGELACEDCHPRTAAPDANGRTFGRAKQQTGPADCAHCHADPHAGAFDRPGFARQVQGKSSCARCHVESSFRAFTGAFEHGLWTGFTLQGAHRRLDCAACHPRQEPDANGRTWGHARGTACADCHQDPHAGQFAETGVTDCRPCHLGGERFRETSFRHDVHSRFRLGEQHEKLACSACHKPYRDGDRDVVRYRPLPTRCVDCHGQSESPFPRRTGGGR